jgi:hypothetical protein
MPEWLAPLAAGPAVEPVVVLVRLAAALVLGGLVALVYRATRGQSLAAPSFLATLVLLSVLIAMVTQVIGDNIARAFSLVGALSIVRFRTVVRDTQDTAYVIFAVAVGMAVGAGNLWVAVAGIAVVAVAAVIMMKRGWSEGEAGPLPFLLQVRLGVGQDADALLTATLDQHTSRRRMMSLATARQGTSMDVAYRADLREDQSAGALVKGINRLEGVQAVTLTRIEPAE